MDKLIALLDGNKTYICAALLIVASVLHGLGYLDDETFLTVGGLLLGGGIGSARHAIAKKK
jgi:hypothetical protein